MTCADDPILKLVQSITEIARPVVGAPCVNVIVFPVTDCVTDAVNPLVVFEITVEVLTGTGS